MSLESERRFCQTCCKDVDTDVVSETIEVPILNEKVKIEFDAHRCPLCGEFLCERGFDEVVMELIAKAYKEKTGKPLEEIEGREQDET